MVGASQSQNTGDSFKMALKSKDVITVGDRAWTECPACGEWCEVNQDDSGDCSAYCSECGKRTEVINKKMEIPDGE